MEKSSNFFIRSLFPDALEELFVHRFQKININREIFFETTGLKIEGFIDHVLRFMA